jgi:protein gp37
MTQLGPYEVHPFADEFPLIEGEEFEELVSDIKRQGLRQPIVLNHDRTVLIDGRNRFRACEAAGVDPVFETLPAHYTEAMVLNYVVSTNIERRHLSVGQKALVGLRYQDLFARAIKSEEEARKSRFPSTRKTDIPDSTPADLQESTTRPVTRMSRAERESAAQAARLVGTSTRAIYQAKALERDAPDLAEEVKKGMPIDRAYRQRSERVRAQPRPEPVPTKRGPVMLTLRTHSGEEVPYPKPTAKATFNETRGEGISWAGWSWNPVTGCLHGCGYCYAREIATNERFKGAFPVGFTPLFHHERLDAPANTVIPAHYRDDSHPSPCGTPGCKVCEYRRVFVCSMADLYGRWVPSEWINAVHAAMLESPQWQYILLTKFPARYVGLDMPSGAWVGTSVDEQKRVRIAEDAFRDINGVTVKWLSLEPLREPLEFTDLSVFDWVVIGGQTETRQPDGVVEAFAPPFEWVARIVLQAREAGCRIHLKPNLLGRVNPQLPGMQLPDEYPGAVA